MMKKYFSVCCFILFGLSSFGQTIVVGQGSGSSTGAPIASWYNSSASESIYKGSEVGTPIEITNIAYNKASGSSTEEPYIQIYMKMTAVDVLSANYTMNNHGFSDYTLVYEGILPNYTTNGWMDVTLQSPFAFDDLSQNLSVLVTGFTCISSGRPQYTYSTTNGSKLSATYNDGTIGCDGDNPWNEYSEMKPIWERPNISLSGNFLNNNSFTSNKYDILVSRENNGVKVISSKNAIQDITIYDGNGKRVFSKSNINQTVFQTTFSQEFKGLYVLKIQDVLGQTITKKVIFEL